MANFAIVTSSRLKSEQRETVARFMQQQRVLPSNGEMSVGSLWRPGSEVVCRLARADGPAALSDVHAAGALGHQRRPRDSAHCCEPA